MGRSARLAVLAVACAVAVAWVGTLAAYARVKFGGDARGLLFLGSRFPHPPALAGVPIVGRDGYDGQFYAALAADPFLRSPDTLRALDAPGYRAARILVPMAAWLASLGRPATAVVVYQALCWTLSVAGVVVAAAWIRREGGAPWWALLLALDAGLVAAMLRTTLDGAAACLVVATLFLARGGDRRWALAAAAAATLCREVSYVVPLAWALSEALGRRLRPALLWATLPAVPWLAWQAYIRLVWHPNLRLPSSVAAPFSALAEKIAAVIAGRPSLASPELWGTLAACLTVVAGIAVAARAGRFEPERLAFVAFALLPLLLAARAYADVYGFSRQLIVAPFLALPLAAGERGVWMRSLLLAGPAAFAVAGLAVLLGELRPILGQP